MPEGGTILSRDQHLFGPGPKRILALDGGGVRGVVALGFLERIEAVLRARHGGDPGFRLAQYFDLIGGTSTGAIIAAGLALGLSVAEVQLLYAELAPLAFRRSVWRVPGVQARFDARPLTRALEAQLGARTLASPDLLTGLAVVTKRMDTGSPWVLSNNPRAPYWDDPPNGAHIGNRHYRLAALVRASAAAPLLFPPQRIAVAEQAPAGLFVDGAVSPHNNPALQLLMLATMRGFGLGWPTGVEKLLVVSVGTGSFRERLDAQAGARGSAAALAARALIGMINDSQTLVLTMMQWLSEAAAPWPINSEIGDLREETLGGRSLLAFQRYDLPLEADWLAQALGERLTVRQLRALRRLDNVADMPRLGGLAARAAAMQVVPGHFPPGFDRT